MVQEPGHGDTDKDMKFTSQQEDRKSGDACNSLQLVFFRPGFSEK
jgi:hypothetical protein